MIARCSNEHARNTATAPSAGAIEDGFAETAGRLGFTLAPVPVGDAMVDEIVGRSRDETGGRPDDELAARRSRPSRGWLALVAAAVVAVSLVVAVTVLRPSTTSITQASPSQRVVTFTGDGEGTLAMAYTPGQPGAVFWGSRPSRPGSRQGLRDLDDRG